ncbi:MAG: hypothetical protein PHH16_00980 [Candidatus Gracilibacteria bacterium]|nr:hypothetical protein [Candidatus Gracilibacteria bacterium]
MRIYTTARIFLSCILFASLMFSLLGSPFAQAETSSSVTLSPAITAKLDVFIGKVKALRPKYSSDADWSMFIDKLSGKVIALKPQYIENPLILTVLNRLNSGIIGLRNISTSAASSNDIDLCAKEGLKNIDETNFNPDRDVFDCHPTGSQSWNPSWCHYRMNAGESYSFPFTDADGQTTSDGYRLLPFSGDEYALNGSVDPMEVISVSERKCDFVKPIIGNQLTQISVLFDPKFADPNASHPGGYTHYLVPGKKYYYNVRWAKRSDFSDNGAALDKQYAGLGGAFNSKGDTCLGKIGSGGKMRDDCAINPNFSGKGSMPGLPKFSPAKAMEQERIRQAELQAGTANQVGPLPPANQITQTTNTTSPVQQCQSGGSSATLQWKCGCTSSPGAGWVSQGNGCYQHAP